MGIPHLVVGELNNTRTSHHHHMYMMYLIGDVAGDGVESIIYTPQGNRAGHVGTPPGLADIDVTLTASFNYAFYQNEKMPIRLS